MTEEQASRGLSVIDIRLVEDRDGVWRVSVEGTRTRATGDRPSQAIDALARILSGLAWSSETTEQDVVAGRTPDLFGPANIHQSAAAAWAAVAAVAAGIEASVFAPPGFDLATFFDEKARWSSETFGPGSRGVEVVRHIRKELGEIERAPTDLEEWVDVVLLAMDGAWRSAGATGQSFVEALRAKHQKNLQRTWSTGPDGVTEHVREGQGRPIEIGSIVRVAAGPAHDGERSLVRVEPLGSLTDPEWASVTIEAAFQRCGELARELELVAKERAEFDVIASNAEARARQLEQAAIGSDAEKVRVLEEQATAMGEQLSALTERLGEAERDRDAEMEKKATLLRALYPGDFPALPAHLAAAPKAERLGLAVADIGALHQRARPTAAQNPAENEGTPRAGRAVGDWSVYGWGSPGLWTVATRGLPRPAKLVSTGSVSRGRWWDAVGTAGEATHAELDCRRPATPEEAGLYEQVLQRARTATEGATQ